MGRTTNHIAVSLDIDRFTDARLRKDHCKWITRADGSKMTPTELRNEIAKLRAHGFEVFPPCDDHDERGICKGHPINDGLP